MPEPQQVDVENVNRLFSKFQQRIGELSVANIALENEIERLVEVVSELKGRLESQQSPSYIDSAEEPTPEYQPEVLFN